MLSSRLPKQSNISKERQESVVKFNDSLHQIYDEVLKDYNEEKKRTAHLSGFKRTLNPTYRVPFPNLLDIEECKSETMNMLSCLKSTDSQRINSSAFNSRNKNPTFDPLKPRMNLKGKRKQLSEERVDIIENTSLSMPMSSNTNKKLKLTSVKAKDIPDSISQYNFKSDAGNSLENTFKNKSATPNNIAGSIHQSLETMNAVMDGLETEYREKVDLLKERKQEEQEKLKKDQDLRLIQTRIDLANKPKSRFQSSHTESRFEGHGRQNMPENADESESD